jgi:REP element-mobilizing transposase RayT
MAANICSAASPFGIVSVGARSIASQVASWFNLAKQRSELRMEKPPQFKREHLHELVAGKQQWGEPLTEEARARGFRGWHERGYLPHCDKSGLVQFITFRLWDSLPASRKGEWEHLLAVAGRSDAPRSGTRSIASLDPAKTGAQRITSREQRVKLEDYIDRGLGECLLRDSRIAALMEDTMRFHHGQRFELLAWVVMPNHVHALIQVGDTPLSKIVQNWKSIVAVKGNKLLGRTGDFWQLDYWDTFMRAEEQNIRAVRYIENNPVKARLCRAPEAWPFSSARFRDPQSRELKLPPQ